MPDDLAKDTVPAPAKPKDAPVPDTPFSERSDGLDTNIDQGLVEYKNRMREELLRKGGISPTSIKEGSGGNDVIAR